MTNSPEERARKIAATLASDFLSHGDMPVGYIDSARMIYLAIQSAITAEHEAIQREFKARYFHKRALRILIDICHSRGEK